MAAQLAVKIRPAANPCHILFSKVQNSFSVSIQEPQVLSSQKCVSKIINQMQVVWGWGKKVQNKPLGLKMPSVSCGCCQLRLK